MSDALQELLTSQGGVLTRAQARAVGVPATQLGPPGAGRLLVRVRPGVYAESVAALRPRSERTALLVAAERLVSGVDLVAAGRTAAALHDLPFLGRAPARPRLVERRSLRPRHHGRSRTLLEPDVVERHGVPVLSLACTAVDVARATDLAGGVVTADAALAQGLEPEELARALLACSRWPGARRARAAVAFADGRAESPLESLGRVRFAEHGLPAPDLQVQLLGDVRVDHCWREHRTVAEADGAVKYTDPAALFAEKQREDRLREAGFEVVRYTWDEALRTPTVVVVRVQRAFARAARAA